ncbi:helix-turn-helix domain-containing protein [Methylophilus sp. 5]|uniref:winged helix-turn-helix transcriptional regulator n=1 Tax=Methylophilus sp. 5 TaxID=1112274 RepID=UPI0004BC16CC|nr:helix-turn-helix domain-containing protein [Methylophilus sp. 5]
MKNKSLLDMPCPIAKSLEHVGEWWNILILREALLGVCRFDDFQSHLGIATSTLAKRLNAMVESGLLERRQYCEKPPRDEYVITQQGLDFRPVLLTIMQWGNKYYADGEPTIQLVDTHTNQAVDLMLVDRNTNMEIDPQRHRSQAGPAADELIKARFKR